MKSTQTNTEKEAQGGNKREGGWGGGGGSQRCPKRIARAAVMLSFFILSPISLWPSSFFSFSGPRFAFSYFFGLLQTKQNAKQTYFLYTEGEGGGREVGREAEPTHLYVNMKSSKHTHLACSNTHSYKHTHTRPHSHTHTCEHSHSRTHTFLDAHMSATWCCFQFKLHFLLLPLLLRRGYSYFHTRWSSHFNPHAYKVLNANYTRPYTVLYGN